MNWLGQLVQEEIKKEDSVISLGCGILQEIDGLKCKSFKGIDIYEPYIKKVKEKGYDIELQDITKMKYSENSYDIVLALDIIEHLKFIDVKKLIPLFKKMAKKKVIIYTPSKFYNNFNHDFTGEKGTPLKFLNESNESPYKGLGINLYQKHLCLITKKYLENLGFQTKIIKPDNNIYAIWSKENENIIN